MKSFIQFIFFKFINVSFLPLAFKSSSGGFSSFADLAQRHLILQRLHSSLVRKSKNKNKSKDHIKWSSLPLAFFFFLKFLKVDLLPLAFRSSSGGSPLWDLAQRHLIPTKLFFLLGRFFHQTFLRASLLPQPGTCRTYFIGLQPRNCASSVSLSRGFFFICEVFSFDLLKWYCVRYLWLGLRLRLIVVLALFSVKHALQRALCFQESKRRNFTQNFCLSENTCLNTNVQVFDVQKFFFFLLRQDVTDSNKNSFGISSSQKYFREICILQASTKLYNNVL